MTPPSRLALYLQAGIEQVGDFLNRHFSPPVDVQPAGQYNSCGCGPDLFDPSVQRLDEAQAQQSMRMMKRGDGYKPGRESGAQGAGAEFEDELSQKFGGSQGFRLGGRDFDGRAGSIWYEAKSGWGAILNKPGKLGLFKSVTGEQAAIARKYGRSFAVFSKGAIPDSIKSWLTKKGIGYREF